MLEQFPVGEREDVPKKEEKKKKKSCNKNSNLYCNLKDESLANTSCIYLQVTFSSSATLSVPVE